MTMLTHILAWPVTPLRYPLGWLLRLEKDGSRGFKQPSLDTRLQGVKALQSFQNPSDTATLVLRDFIDNTHYFFPFGSNEWDNDQCWPIVLELLQCGADLTAVDSLPYGKEYRRPGEVGLKREVSVLELIIVRAWDAQENSQRKQSWGFFERRVIDVLLATPRSEEGLFRRVPIFYDLWNKDWSEIGRVFDADIFGVVERTSIKFVYQVNLAHLLHRILLNNPHHQVSATAMKKLESLQSNALREPVRLIGVSTYLPPSGHQSCYRIYETLFLRRSSTAEEMWQLKTIQFRPYVTEFRVRRLIKSGEEYGKRHGVIKKVRDLPQLLIQEGLGTYK